METLPWRAQKINMSRMFYGCKKLKYLDLSPFVINDDSNIDEMFYNCPNLQNLILYPFDIKNNLNINNNFYGNDKINLQLDKKNEEFAKIKDIPSSIIKNMIKIKEYIIVFLGGIKKKDNYSYLLKKIKKEYNNKNNNKIIIKKIMSKI